MFGIHRNFPAGGGGSTGDATAEQWDIKNGKTAYIASGKVTGSGYFPAMMEFDGSSGYYSDTYTASGNKMCGILVFNRATFATNDYEVLVGSSATHQRTLLAMFSTDYAADTDRQGLLQLQVTSSAGAILCRLLANASHLDGENHTVQWGFDGDAGTAYLRIDGADADDTGHPDRSAPTTGTLETGAGFPMSIGGWGGVKHFQGRLGFCGFRQAYLTNFSDFVQTDGTPKPLDESTWTEWGAQPEAWHEAAKMDESLGSTGVFTKNGTITLASAQ